jgi:outer membrane biosynthesis protein TonB
MYKKITSIVISFHILFMMLLLFNNQKSPIKRNAHITVRTVRPTASMTTQKKTAPITSKQAPPFVPAKKTPTKSAPKPQIAAKKPPTSNKPVVVEKNKPIKKAVPKKTEPPAKIWDEIDQALAKIEKKSYPSSKQSVNLPQLPMFLDEQVSGEDNRALSDLVGFLHETLHLPEIGEVKVALTVRKDGTIAKAVVLQSESRKNKLYLEEHLPRLQLPMNFDIEKTWTLTFCNEI